MQTPAQIVPLSSTAAAATAAAAVPDEFARLASMIGQQISLPSDDVFVQYTQSRLLGGLDTTAIVISSRSDRSLVQKAFLALATTFFGLDHREKNLISQGFRRYGNALRSVHQALGDQSRYRSLDLLESISVMALFEV